MRLKKNNFLGYEIFSDELINLITFLNQNPKTVISCLNPHSLVVAERLPEFNKALKNSTVLLCDGVGISLFSGIARVRGEDIFNFLLKNSSLINVKKIMFIGSTQDTLEKIHERTMYDFPNLKVETYSPVFSSSYFLVDDGIFDAIDNFEPDIVFFGLSAPKQEIFSYSNFDRIHSRVIVNIGAVFDYYSGNIASPPTFMISTGTEWVYRLFMQPKKILPRVFVSTFVYLTIVFKYFIKSHK